jgi:hypothetical protein
MPPQRASGEAGFTIIELLIAMLITVVVLGSAVGIVGGAQNTYSHQLDDVTVEQEARFALDFIRRTIEPAGSNPYSVSVTPCPVANTAVMPIRMNPDGVNGNDDIRIMADVGIPDGLIVGSAGACTQPNEDVTIARSAVRDSQGRAAITRYDRGVDAAPVAWTDQLFTGLLFEYFDANMVSTAAVGSVRVIRVTLTGLSRKHGDVGTFTPFTLTTNVRLRAQ